ncbi:hypothetical protein CACET_c27220 [Clostridium aceticum]|uniref:Uncharacterized protein n=1 Tax=Clostridium aceticum TaxID=84022 RepID=A0A0D8I8J6_9CLOT|nr:hypothetical protein [Clostridium aceticum]AKL96167.1 hypothetical protein CACET_c27220 [Clostridium aceticum]KJF26588.1 hypothetical protein TZ02_11980 [Clostridium aceticum]
MKTKRKQYLINQFQLRDIKKCEDKNEYSIKVKKEHKPVQQSENFLFYMTYKITGRVPAADQSNPLNEIISITTGRGANADDKALLGKILNKGFFFKDKKYVFLDVSLSGSQHKTCKQYYVSEGIYKKLKERITLGKEPNITVPSKYLTAVALMTTSCNLFDIKDYIDQLDICVIDDLEYELENQHIVYNAPYKRTDEEEILYQSYMEALEAIKGYEKALAEGKKLAKNKEIPKRKKSNKETEKTINQWKEEGLRPKLEEAAKPISMVFAKGIYKWIPCYTKQQCERIPEERFVFPVDKITTEVEFKEEIKNVPINFADGTALMDINFAEKLGMKLEDQGGQLRFPYCKAFFNILELREWLKEEGVESITDLFGNPHPVDGIDILMTKSCFKAFLEKGETDYKDGCLFKDMDEYKDLIKNYDFDTFGIANYVHPPKSKYTKITYQMLLALKLKDVYMPMFAQDECDMINKVIKIYSDTGDVNWDDVKYILAFLNMLKDEKEEISFNEDDEDNEDHEIEANPILDDEAEEIDTNENWEEPIIQAIKINKNMVFDPYVRKKILQRIEHMINEMRLGKMYMPCNYYFATCHIPTLIHWAINRDTEIIKEMVPQNKVFMGKTKGMYVAMRNPVTSYSEVAKLEFIPDTCKWTEHLNHIIQFGEGLYMHRMNLDYDGDKICLFSIDRNYKEMEMTWLAWCKTIKVEDSNAYIYTHSKKEKDLNKINNQGTVTLLDFLQEALPQVNYADKDTVEPVAFTKEAVVSFILHADDKTGQITDKATQVENRMMAERKTKKYQDAIRYGKYLQGLQIDASKSGLPVEICKSFQYNFRKKPTFLYYKSGGSKWKYDNQYESPLDWFAEKLLSKYEKWIGEQINKNTRKRKDGEILKNTLALLENPNLDYAVIKEYEAKLEPEFLRYKDKFKKINERYKTIDKYSKADENKEQRKLKRREYSDLNKKTRERIYKLCPNPSVVAQVAVNYAYKYSKENSKDKKDLRWQDNWNFAWMFPEGILYHLWLNQDEDKIDVLGSDERCHYDFNLLDHYYIVKDDMKIYKQEEIEEISDIEVLEEYLAKEPANDLELTNVLCMGLDKGLTTDDIANRVYDGAVLQLKINDGYPQLWDATGKIIGIKHDILKQYEGSRIVIKKVYEDAKSTRTITVDCSIKAIA